MKSTPIAYATFLALVSLIIGSGFGAQSAPAAESSTPGGSQHSEGADGEDEEKSIAELTENSERIDGLFTVYRDKKTGEVHLAIRPGQIGQEFIYFAYSVDGVVQGGHFRGQYLTNSVIALERHFDRVDFIAENTAYHFDEDSPLSRAAAANISPAILVTAKILAEDDDGTLLIKASDFLLKEDLLQVKPTPDPEADAKTTFSLGKLSENRGKLEAIRNYPLNSDFIVDYVYENQQPTVQGEPDITDSRYITIRVQHSLIAMPDNDYRQRRDDFRVGFFTGQITDLTSTSHTPYRDVIARWDLRKEDPSATVSNAVEPIVWWMENTTPYEFRDTIRHAALAWNSAFETAGISNAIVVRQQPDDADWDAGDIRYNVLRWTSSPTPPFSGYGPAFANPRTGQILGADVMLEYSAIARRVRLLKLLESSGFSPDPGTDVTAGRYCSLGQGMQISQLFGRQALRAMGAGPELEEQMVHEMLHYLILHEIGHTLGMNHNMRATQLLALDEVFDDDAVAQAGLAGSVMDYPSVNIAPPGKNQTQFFATRPGPYDDWLIEYGYSQALDDPGAEQARLAQIASRSTRPELAFGNDADDMRSPGKAIDPRVNIYDMSNDAIGYAIERFDLIAKVLRDMDQRYAAGGESYQELHDGYVAIVAEIGRSAHVISRYIGGVYVNRAVVGQPGAMMPFEPVSRPDQERAMAALRQRLFAPGAFTAPAGLYGRLQQQRRGFDFYEVTEDPKLHDWMLGLQKGVLDHLTHPAVMKRITDSRLYGNDYPLAEVMEDLTQAIFAADANSDVDTFRQNLQLDYVSRLANIVDAGKAAYDYPSQSAALYQLERIKKTLASRRKGNAETRAHTLNVMLTIERALDPRA